MKFNSYKLTERDIMNLKSIKDLLQKIQMNASEIGQCLHSNGEYTKKFDTKDHNESVETEGWIDQILKNSM